MRTEERTEERTGRGIENEGGELERTGEGVGYRVRERTERGGERRES